MPPEAAGPGIPAARAGEQPLDPAGPMDAAVPGQGAEGMPQAAAPIGDADPYGAVPQQPSYDDWQAAQQGGPVPPAHPADQQPYAPAEPYQAGQYGQQPYPQAGPYQAADPYAADPYQAGVYDPYGYGEQQYGDGGPQQQPYDDGTEYPGYSGSYPEPRRDGSDQQ